MKKGGGWDTCGGVLEGTIGSFITPDGSMSMSVPLSTVGEGFRQYYVTSKVHQRDLTDKSNRDWAQWTLEEFMSLARTRCSASMHP